MTVISLDPSVLSGRLGQNATTDEKLVATVRLYESRVASAGTVMQECYKACKAIFYSNKFQLTPTQIAEYVGQETALDMRRHAIALKSLLLFVSPSLADDPAFQDNIPVIDLAAAMPQNLFPE